MATPEKIKQFKNEVEQYLASKDIKLTFEEAIREQARWADQPLNRRQNEIDSALATNDEELDEWLDSQFSKAVKELK